MKIVSCILLTVTAPDLRAGAALVVAAIMARGESEIHGLNHIDRGYEKFTEKLKGLGVCVSRVDDDAQASTFGGFNDAHL